MGVANGRDLMHEEEEKEKKNDNIQPNQNKEWRHERDAAKLKHRQVKIDLPDKSDHHTDNNTQR